MTITLRLNRQHARQALQRRCGYRLPQRQRDRLVIARARLQLIRRAIGQQTPATDDHGARANRADFFQDMGGDHYHLVAAFSQLLNQTADVVLLVWVQTVGWLIQNQYLRVVQDGLGQTNTAFEALGQGLDALAEYALQLNLLDRPIHVTLALGTTQATHIGNKFKKAPDPHVAIARRPFGQVAHLLLGLQGLALNIKAADRGRTAIGRQKARQHLHGGGFAGPVGPKKTEHFSRLHIKR